MPRPESRRSKGRRPTGKGSKDQRGRTTERRGSSKRSGESRRRSDAATPRRQQSTRRRSDDSKSSASAAWQQATEAARRAREAADDRPDDSPRRAKPTEPEPPWEPEQWLDEGSVRDQAEGAVGRGRRPKAKRPRWEPEPLDADDIAEALGTRQSGAERRQDLEEDVRAAVGMAKSRGALRRLSEAIEAFKRGRFDEARSALRPLAQQAPRVAAIRELYGLALYRLGRWRPASKELEAFRDLSRSVEQHPVLADCYRALNRHKDVEQLWDELRAASPGQELVAEGRIVAAGSLADQGRVRDAIALLEPGIRPARRTKLHHLRVAYALADLYERAGELPQAREMFQRVASVQPDFVDVKARLRSLD